MTTILLYGEGLNAAWMIVIGSFLLVLPSLLILNHVLKIYQSKHLLEITQLTLGKYVAYGIGFIMLCFLVVNTALDSRSYMTQLSIINYPQTPLFIFYLCYLNRLYLGCKERMGVAWFHCMDYYTFLPSSH